jgi:hypothetical protein
MAKGAVRRVGRLTAVLLVLALLPLSGPSFAMRSLTRCAAVLRLSGQRLQRWT